MKQIQEDKIISEFLKSLGPLQKMSRLTLAKSIVQFSVSLL